VRKVKAGGVNHHLQTHVKTGEVGVGDRVDGVGYDTINVGGMDTEGSDTGEYVTSSHEVLRE